MPNVNVVFGSSSCDAEWQKRAIYINQVVKKYGVQFVNISLNN